MTRPARKWQCSLCGAGPFPIYQEHRVEITGWATAKAGKSIVAQRRTGRVACTSCVEKLRGGIPPTQESLV